VHSLRSFLATLSFAHKANKMENPIQPFIIRLITKNSKGCRSIYDSFSNNKVSPRSRRKWELELNLMNNINWKFVYNLPFKTTKDPKLQWLQVRINHRILGTNYLRAKMGLRNDNLCTFCLGAPETIKHLFWECAIVQQFWNNIRIWILSKIPSFIMDLTESNILFGINDKHSTALNSILLTAKYHIYQCKMKSSAPVIEVFKKQVSSLIKAEKFNAQKTFKMNYFDTVWQRYTALL
jgi:hypothetical protein